MPPRTLTPQTLSPPPPFAGGSDSNGDGDIDAVAGAVATYSLVSIPLQARRRSAASLQRARGGGGVLSGRGLCSHLTHAHTRTAYTHALIVATRTCAPTRACTVSAPPAKSRGPKTSPAAAPRSPRTVPEHLATPPLFPSQAAAARAVSAGGALPAALVQVGWARRARTSYSLILYTHFILICMSRCTHEQVRCRRR